jgi:DNA-binding IclR family transcriptional regulator
VSAPVLDANGHLLAVLSIWGPGDRITEARLDPLGALIRDATTLLGRHWAEHTTA